MNQFHRFYPAKWAQLLICTMLLASGPLAAQEAAPASEVGQPDSATSDRLTLLLKNMPMNSSQRCVGIAGVTEALLGGEQVADPPSDDTLATLATEIFTSFRTGKQVTFPASLLIEGRPLPITASPALDRLVTAVADEYKSQHAELIGNDQGIQRLLAAEDQHVASLAKLTELLKADPDQTDFYCCFGRRWFPDGTVKDTSHAVLIRLDSDAQLAVYDPNEPGVAQQAKFADTASGLEVEWTCPYRDTGKITTQRYRIVPKGQFFRTAMGDD